MTGRLLVAAATTAVLLGATVAPAAAGTAGTPATATSGTAGTRATAAGTTAAGAPAVALLVQYPGGSVRTWCVPYRAGMSGADVLAPATPTYGTGPYAGFVLKVTGKGTVPPTADRYWAYWRSPTGKSADYVYSGTGVTSTRPAARSVEAWVWNTGPATTFPKRTYAKACPNGATTAS